MQELIFLRLAVSTALLGPFAMVENEMVFQNPENRVMEGHELRVCACVVLAVLAFLLSY